MVFSNRLGQRRRRAASSTPLVTPREMLTAQGKAFAGGTFQARNSSPDAAWECEGSDVGGVRRRRSGEMVWENMPTAGHDADRKVAGVVILDDGTVFSLVGNGASAGRMLRYRPDGTVDVLATGLDVRANSKSPDDSDSRPRAVGWMLHYDPPDEILYACTGDGLYRHHLDGSFSGIVALGGEALRGFVHADAITVGEIASLTVCTRTRGVVRVDDVQGLGGYPSTKDIGSPSRAEDGAWTPGGNVLAACQRQGLHRIDPSDGSSVDVTPEQVTGEHDSTGANGGPVSWAAVDVHRATGTAVATMINPTHGDGWVWRSSVPIDQATPGDWEAITCTQITLEAGVDYLQPKSRMPGGKAKGGAGLTGGQHVSFVRSDPSGNTVKSLNTLVTGLTTNAQATDPTTVTWVSDVEGSSLLSMVDVDVSDSGVMVLSVADHNTMVSPDIDTADTVEPNRVAVLGLGGAYGVCHIGGVWVVCPVEEAHWEDPKHSWHFFSGSGAPDSWSSVGWEDHDWNGASDFPVGLAPLPGGVPPRPVSVCGHVHTGGSIRFFGMADGVGFVYQDYDPATRSWGTPKIGHGGPTNGDVISESQNTARSSACTADGSLVLHQLQKNGHIYRSLDRGASVERIASGSNGAEIAAGVQVRTGFMRLHEDGDFAVVSNKDGLYAIRDVSDVDPEVVQIASGKMGPIAIDPATGVTYMHRNQSGLAELLRFDDIATATSLADGKDIATRRYGGHLGDQASQLYAVRRGGELRLITLYQGGGFVVSAP